ncbi:MAG: hypothetical protein WBV82_23100 [Myxococcaceae bacterium]
MGRRGHPDRHAAEGRIPDTWYVARRIAGHSGTPLPKRLGGRQREAGDVLVQRYLPEITTEGEWSFVFFDGRFSHAVRKRPKPGDFRVQMDHGGTVAPEVPSEAIVDDASRVIAALPARADYARVDGVDVKGRLLLMEAAERLREIVCRR